MCTIPDEPISICECVSGFVLDIGACVAESQCFEQTEMNIGTCWSGNWTQYMNEDDATDGADNNTYRYTCRNQFHKIFSSHSMTQY